MCHNLTPPPPHSHTHFVMYWLLNEFGGKSTRLAELCLTAGLRRLGNNNRLNHCKTVNKFKKYNYNKLNNSLLLMGSSGLTSNMVSKPRLKTPG